MRVTMIGAGYVGLVSGACFADFGHQVTCIDKDTAKIASLNRGEIPIFEPGLAELVESNVRQARLEFAAEASQIGEADAVFIAVGTPSRRGDGHADLSFVYQSVRDIAPLLGSAAVVITKSTVPVYAKEQQSKTSSILIASWLVATMTVRARCWPTSIARFI
jgi:UDPglucose 6-dehydrogenase